MLLERRSIPELEELLEERLTLLRESRGEKPTSEAYRLTPRRQEPAPSVDGALPCLSRVTLWGRQSSTLAARPATGRDLTSSRTSPSMTSSEAALRDAGLGPCPGPCGPGPKPEAAACHPAHTHRPGAGGRRPPPATARATGRVNGRTRKNPTKSVMNPGASSSIPPIMTNAASASWRGRHRARCAAPPAGRPRHARPRGGRARHRTSTPARSRKKVCQPPMARPTAMMSHDLEHGDDEQQQHQRAPVATGAAARRVVTAPLTVGASRGRRGRADERPRSCPPGAHTPHLVTLGSPPGRCRPPIFETRRSRARRTRSAPRRRSVRTSRRGGHVDLEAVSLGLDRVEVHRVQRARCGRRGSRRSRRGPTCRASPRM